MNWNPIEGRLHRVKARLASRWEALRRALAENWLTKLKLKDHYAERRPSS